MTASVLDFDPRAAPALARMVRQAAVRVRLYRAGRAMLGAAITVLFAGIVLVAWELVVPALELPWLPVIPLGPAMGLVALAGIAHTVVSGLRRPDAAAIVRRLDRALDLDDRAATALAIATGRVRGGLAERALADAERVLGAAAPGVADAFPARPGLATARQLRRLALLVAVGLLGAFLGGFVEDAPSFSFALPGLGPQDPGETGSATGAAPTEEPDEPSDQESPQPPDGADPQPAHEGPLPEEPPPGEPGARARVVSLREHYLQGEPVTVVVSGFPTVHLREPTSYRIELEIDGARVDPGRRLWIEPENPAGEAEALDLRTLSAADRLLGPGRHTIVAELVPQDASPAARSPEAGFQIHGDGEDDGGGSGSGGGGADQPEEAPGPGEQPESPPPDQPDRTAPPDPPEPPPGAGDPPPPDPPPAAPPPGGRQPEEPDRPDRAPEIDPGFETKVVIPLFGEGETVTKEGPVLVLVPGRGDDPAPLSRPLAEVLHDAVRQAEEAVDRARLDEADRALVKRYFERIERLLR